MDKVKKNPSYREIFDKKSTIIGRIIKVLALSEGEIPFFPETTAFSYPMGVTTNNHIKLHLYNTPTAATTWTEVVAAVIAIVPVFGTLVVND